MTPIFPEYFDQGTSDPVAANVLGLLLKAAGYDPEHKIVLDGDFAVDGEIAKALKRAQEDLGFTGVDVDGNFGPRTRDAFRASSGIDVNLLTREQFTVPSASPWMGD